MKPRFHFLTGDVNWLSYGGKWISQKFNNGEFDYWIVLELVNFEDACGSTNPKYGVQLSAVSPSQVPEEEIAKAIDSFGLDKINFNQLTDERKVEIIESYGISAFWGKWEGNNAHKLLKEAKKRAFELNFLFGFTMDRPVNAIGTSGWDAIRGDVLAGLKKES